MFAPWSGEPCKPWLWVRFAQPVPKITFILLRPAPTGRGKERKGGCPSDRSLHNEREKNICQRKCERVASGGKQDEEKLMKWINLRLRDEVFVLWGKVELVVAWQFRGGLHHDLLQLLERRRPRFVRKLSCGNLKHRDAEAPDVGAHVVCGGVALRVDPFGLNRNEFVRARSTSEEPKARHQISAKPQSDLMNFYNTQVGREP